MSKNLIIIISIFLLFSMIQTKKKGKKKEKKEFNDDIKDIDNNKTLKTDINANETESQQDGIYMSEQRFDEKLQKFIKEKKLKPKNKISKEYLKIIFDEVYKIDFNIPDLPDGEELHTDPKEEGKKFMGQIFEKATKGLDYDDKIKVKDIKEWIAPKHAQEALMEVMNDMQERMDYL